MMYFFFIFALACTLLSLLFMEATVLKLLLVFVCGFVVAHLLFVLSILVLRIFYRKCKVEKQSRILREYIYWVGQILCFYGGISAEVEGEELLPEDRRFLYVCNHRSMFDPLVVMAKMKKHNICFIAKPSVMAIPVIGTLAEHACFLGIDRENNREALKTILTAADYMKKDMCSIGIFPEGTRSKTAQLLDFHAGSYKIAQRASAPVAVAAISGTENIKKNILRRRTKVKLKILELIPAETVKASSTAELAAHSMEIIAKALEQ